MNPDPIVESLIRHVVPICEKDERGHTQGFASGLLVSHDVNHYLVTAAHALDPLKEERRLFFPCANKGERSVGGRMLLSSAPEGLRKFDKVDIGVAKLEGDWQPPYPEIGKQGLSLNRLRPSAPSHAGHNCLVTGFPATKVKTHVKHELVETYPQTIVGVALESSKLQSHNLDVGAHIAIPFNIKNVHGKNGTRQRFPSPTGLSGSPIWSLSGDEADADKICVAGILIEYRQKHQLLVGTNIIVAIDMIRHLT